MNSQSLEQETFEALQGLAAAWLIDPGYAGLQESTPYNWISNGNGERAEVLRSSAA